MEMKINELKKLQSEFNRKASRLIRSDLDDFVTNTNKFINFLESNEIIKKYILSCGISDQDMDKEFNEINDSYGHMIFDIGDSDDEEVSVIYAILKHIAKNKLDPRLGYIMGYSHSKHYQDMLKAFNERVTFILIQHIEGYLTNIGIDLGLDSNTYTNSGSGQMNIATDNSQQSISNPILNKDELQRLFNSVISELDKNNSNDYEKAQECINTIQNEIETKKPKKRIIKAAIDGLRGIKGTAEFGAAAVTLYEFLKAMGLVP